MSTPNKSEDGVTFSVEILFSEALEFNLAEIAAAVQEDYPQNAVREPNFLPKETIKTDSIILGMLNPVNSLNGKTVTLTGMGFPDKSFQNADHTELAWRSGSTFANAALEAIKTHQSYITLSISTTDRSLAGRFRAARQLTAVAAVFAQLPIALGVLVHWTGHMVAPAKWVAAANAASTDQWPLMEWIAYRAGWDMAHGAQTDSAVGYTIGLTQFLDLEFHLEAAPIQPSDALAVLFGACWLPLQGGSQYRDGDTIGVEGTDLRYLMRRRTTACGTPEPVMSLIHPDSRIDVEAIFGPNPLAKPPPGYDNARKPKSGFMQKLLGRRQTLH